MMIVTVFLIVALLCQVNMVLPVIVVIVTVFLIVALLCQVNMVLPVIVAVFLIVALLCQVNTVLPVIVVIVTVFLIVVLLCQVNTVLPVIVVMVTIFLTVACCLVVPGEPGVAGDRGECRRLSHHRTLPGGAQTRVHQLLGADRSLPSVLPTVPLDTVQFHLTR